MAEIAKGYPNLFGEGEEEDIEDTQERVKPNFITHWNWYWTLDNMSNNDRTKWNYFLEMNVIEFLNTLAYYKDKQNYIADQQRSLLK